VSVTPLREELGMMETAAVASPKTRRALAWGLVILALAIFYFHARIYWAWTEDDAFITFRYARNLASGHGFVFNPGERVEGYSNFVWVLLMAAVERSGNNPERLSKIIGLAAGMLSLVLSWRLAQRLLPRIGLTSVLAPYYLAISPVLVTHSVAGLESSTFAMLLIAAVLAAVQPRPPRLRHSALLVLLLLLLSTSRPEGPLFAFLILLLRGTLVLREWEFTTPLGRFADAGEAQSGRRAVLRETLTWVVMFAAYYAWRWSYFGDPFANTFYAKTNGGLHGVIDGVQYTLDFMRDGGGVLFMAVALVPMLLRGASAAYWMGLTLLLTYTGFVVVAGGDWMYHYRFYAHLLPLLAAFLAVGIDVVLGLAQPKTMRASLLYSTTALVLLATFVGIGNTELRIARIVLPAVQSHNYLSQNYEELGLWFREHSEPNATVAISDVGALGYFSERRVLDMFGLIDPHIARIRGRIHYKADPHYVLSREPDYIVLVSLNDQGAGYSFQRIPDYTINALPEFHEQYELVRTAPQHWHNEYVLVYRRKG
jgi:hypothetical protein